MFWAGNGPCLFVNASFSKLISFPPLGWEYANTMLKMSIDCKPSGPGQGWKLANAEGLVCYER